MWRRFPAACSFDKQKFKMYGTSCAIVLQRYINLSSKQIKGWKISTGLIKYLVLIRDNHGFGNSCVCQCENTEIPAPERFCTLLRLRMDTELKNSEN